jgi:hypothetical protein
MAFPWPGEVKLRKAWVSLSSMRVPLRVVGLKGLVAHGRASAEERDAGRGEFVGRGIFAVVEGEGEGAVGGGEVSAAIEAGEVERCVVVDCGEAVHVADAVGEGEVHFDGGAEGIDEDEGADGEAGVLMGTAADYLENDAGLDEIGDSVVIAGGLEDLEGLDSALGGVDEGGELRYEFADGAEDWSTKKRHANQ